MIGASWSPLSHLHAARGTREGPSWLNGIPSESLLGRPLKAHIVAFRAGHSLDISLGKKIQTRIAMDELASRKDRIQSAEKVSASPV